MTTRDFTANVISASKVVPDGNFKTSKASGVWDINEALDLIKGGNWPNAANIDPAAFVDGLFSTHLYDGNGGTQTITNNINLSGSGGLVWTKRRDSSTNGDHTLYDTERGTGTGGRLRSNNNQRAYSPSDAVTAFNNNGFSIGADASINTNSAEYVSWTFRKQPKFFDVVTYTGDGNYNDGNLYSKAIPHNLGVAPHVIIIKRTDDSSDWWIKHKDRTNYLTKLNSTDSEYQDASPSGSNYLPIFRNGSGVSDATHFYLNAGDHTNGLNSPAAVLSNINGATYVAYLFAHNNDDGGFGEPGDQDIIKCGSYTGNNSTTGPVIDLGFEPQWLFIKHTDASGNSSFILDNMRGVLTGGNDNSLSPNSANDEQTSSDLVEFNASGFQLKRANDNVNGNGNTYIYIAIRRGGMQTPTTASDVFAIGERGQNSPPPAYQAGFTVDMFTNRSDVTASTQWYTYDRLRGKVETLFLDANTDEQAYGGSAYAFDQMQGIGSSTNSDVNNFSWMWKRARGYFDVVAYTGTGSARTVTHNLGVAPEMMWIKMRSSTQNWAVYHKGANGGTDPEDYGLELNSNSAEFDTATYFNDTAPTSSVFTVGTGNAVNKSSETYIAYLFATAAGVSKLGSYTGNGSSQNIDCGFSGGTGARFVLIKNVDATGSWVIFDTTRGLVAGNDNYLQLNAMNAQGGGYDFIDPLESGFTINQTGGVVLNESGETYIFYAIA